ncbi:hypothetical protein QFC24_004627 [Naganishia onofrii]|uniref:Uncharacterized protein n=1 Tax=Naganishia onofrii TaxID=1851511 RepID=A0ACC2XD35_9TREE|nr:hypothetical protein QFC24_004627 [Naganishia onofrii]
MTIWPTKDAPQYRIGFGVVTAMISLGGITTAAIVAIWGKPYNSVNTALSAGPEEPEIDYSERQDKMA